MHGAGNLAASSIKIEVHRGRELRPSSGKSSRHLAYTGMIQTRAPVPTWCLAFEHRTPPFRKLPLVDLSEMRGSAVVLSEHSVVLLLVATR